MILVHRLRGEPMFLNADLIEAVEATPDTLLTLVDGRKTLVTESPEEIVARVVDFRAAVLVAAERLGATSARTPHLTVLPGRET